MSDSLIRSLYFGRIAPLETEDYETEEHKAASKEYSELYNEVKAMLPEDKQNKLDELCSAQNAVIAETECMGFISGFKIGMRLAVEGLTNNQK